MTNLFEQFSSKENLKRAYKYVKTELAYSSLSSDPITYPFIEAIDGLDDLFFDSLQRYIRSGKYQPQKAKYTYSPKDNLGVRPVPLMSVIDRIVYQAILNQEILGYKIDCQLQDKLCLSNRVNQNEVSDRFLINYKELWDELVDRKRDAFESGYKWKIELDIQAYYENIIHSKLCEKLRVDFNITEEDVLELLQKIISSQSEFQELPKSIPQGCSASDVLANVYLNELDTFAQAYIENGKVKYFRYVDDICIFAKTKEEALEVAEEMVLLLRKSGLNVNQKTTVKEIEKVEEIEQYRFFSDYDDYEEDEDYSSPEEVTELERISQEAPTTIRNLLKSLPIDDEKLKIRELKFYVNHCEGLFFQSEINDIIELIKIKPSLTIHIVRFVLKNTVTSFGKSLADTNSEKLWSVYLSPDTREGSRFWILKLLISLQTKKIEVKEELERKSKTDELYAVLYAYFILQDSKYIEYSQIQSLLSRVHNDLFYAHILFFCSYAKELIPKSKLSTLVKDAVGSKNNDLNLIGIFLLDRSAFEDVKKTLCGSFSVWFKEEETKSILFANINEDEYLLVEKKALHNIAEILGTQQRKYQPQVPATFIDVEEVDFEYEKLCSWKDGRITYDTVPVTLRPQLKDLCRLFLKKPNILITFDDIRENVIATRKRDIINNKTLSKYVNELSVVLDAYSRTLKINNNPKEGYILTIQTIEK